MGYLAPSNVWLVDGTYKVTPQLFYQLYTVHAIVHGVVVPMAYGLLSSKSEDTLHKGRQRRELFRQTRRNIPTIQLLPSTAEKLRVNDTGQLTSISVSQKNKPTGPRKLQRQQWRQRNPRQQRLREHQVDRGYKKTTAASTGGVSDQGCRQYSNHLTLQEKPLEQMSAAPNVNRIAYFTKLLSSLELLVLRIKRKQKCHLDWT
ncbi:hypothetical protein ISCGN_019452 [Ixodes scapularis]